MTHDFVPKKFLLRGSHGIKRKFVVGLYGLSITTKGCVPKILLSPLTLKEKTQPQSGGALNTG